MHFLCSSCSGCCAKPNAAHTLLYDVVRLPCRPFSALASAGKVLVARRGQSEDEGVLTRLFCYSDCILRSRNATLHDNPR